MGSIGSPPNDAYKDCAQGICNFYCPQLCNYYYYPPPDIIDDDDSGGPTFSPLIIAIIGILSSAFLLVSYYAIITKYCRRRREQQQTRDSSNLVTDEMSLNQWQAVGGLDENLIDSITVFKYKKGEKLIEGTDCSVCLNEFEENENLRLMPKCCHAFHPSCIDVWLKSHSNCPLCRANAAPIYPAPAPAPITTSSGAVNISALQIQQQNDFVFVVEERERERSPAHQVFVKSPLGGNGSVGSSDQEEVRQLRRSISFSVADILRIDEDDEGLRIQIRETDTGTGCSSEERKLNNTAAVKRSFSTGRFNFYKAS